MKTFTTSGTGNQQTLSEIETDKIPVYDSVTDAEADLANLAENQIIATHDTGSELSAPVDTVQSGNMHAVTSNAVAKSLSYSTTEQKTGGVWIDGKPIYRKVFYSATNWGGVSSTVGTIPVNSNIVSLRSICTDSSNNVTENYFYTTGSSDLNLNQVYYSPNGDIKTLREGIFATQKPSTIIVEYTKTTD